MEPRYLGDGVTASFDGFQIWLEADQEGVRHRIALEAETFSALLQYQRDLANVIKQTQETGPT